MPVPLMDVDTGIETVVIDSLDWEEQCESPFCQQCGMGVHAAAWIVVVSCCGITLNWCKERMRRYETWDLPVQGGVNHRNIVGACGSDHATIIHRIQIGGL